MLASTGFSAKISRLRALKFVGILSRTLSVISSFSVTAASLHNDLDLYHLDAE